MSQRFRDALLRDRSRYALCALAAGPNVAYAHLHDDPLKAASEAVGNKIAASLSDDREGQLIASLHR